MDEIQVPLFPLHAVLFPGGPLPLRVFEPRYLDMVSDCLKREREFGVCLIRQGDEVGQAASTHEVGTLARVADWNVRADGLLGITVHGQGRFQVESVDVQGNQLSVAHVRLMAEEPAAEIPQACRPMVDLLGRMLARFESLYGSLPTHFDDARWVGWRLAELLPLRLSQKQYFLQLTDPLQRLERLGEIVDGMELA
ncbi:MAG: peptidase S16 [Chromatiales bacterium 21-64-14]|nr:MAG: peptidase S16 [Chromatiales bacterium 21-64-14]HQU16587.1 LON peptidase substrate-binding domain-containing protein [Gammaproteobacteria bacterium]